MLILQGYDGGTPTRRLTEELHRQAPDLMVGASPKHADLIVHPVSTEVEPGTTRDRWYTLHWGHPTVARALDGGWDIEYWRGEEIGAVGAPPRIPLEQRRAELPPITLDGMSEQQIRMWGGEEELLRTMHTRRETALAYDHSVDAYDWAAQAARIIDQVRALTPPKLTTPQRAEVAAVRHLRALWELDAARASVRAQIQRTDAAGDQRTADGLLELLDSLDPGYFARRTPPPPGTADGVGRPETGPSTQIRLSRQLRARVDHAARRIPGRRPEATASVIRRVLDASLAPLAAGEEYRLALETDEETA